MSKHLSVHPSGSCGGKYRATGCRCMISVNDLREPSVMSLTSSLSSFDNQEEYDDDFSVMTINKYGHKVWRDQDERFHRPDGPAVEDPNGNRRWYLHGELKRLDGGPVIEWANGRKEWVEDKKWHREDGPAYIDFDGTKKWYFKGVELTEEEFNSHRKNGLMSRFM